MVKLWTADEVSALIAENAKLRAEVERLRKAFELAMQLWCEEDVDGMVDLLIESSK